MKLMIHQLQIERKPKPEQIKTVKKYFGDEFDFYKTNRTRFQNVYVSRTAGPSAGHPGQTLPISATEHLTLITVGNPTIQFPDAMTFMPNIWHPMLEPFTSRTCFTSLMAFLPQAIQDAWKALPPRIQGSVPASFPAYWPRGGDKTGYNNNYPKSRVIVQVLIEMFTAPGDWVIEAFAGSVSALWGCLATGRHLLAVEQDTEQFAFYRARFEADLLQAQTAFPLLLLTEIVPPPPAPPTAPEVIPIESDDSENEGTGRRKRKVVDSDDSDQDDGKNAAGSSGAVERDLEQELEETQGDAVDDQDEVEGGQLDDGEEAEKEVEEVEEDEEEKDEEEEEDEEEDNVETAKSAKTRSRSVRPFTQPLKKPLTTLEVSNSFFKKVKANSQPKVKEASQPPKIKVTLKRPTGSKSKEKEASQEYQFD